MNCTLMVFSDLDGTLIDHDTYAWKPAQEALRELSRTSSGVVLASSKTAPEVSKLRAEMGLDDWPAIVENGAGVLPPFITMTPDTVQYDAVRSALETIPPDLRSYFCGFGDVTSAEVAKMTGLMLTDAKLAQQRSFSEPGKWSGTPCQQDAFLSLLQDQGITAQQGGRFLTLSFGRNKVDQMRTIIETYQPHHTIALGDAPNDIEMLEYADYGVVIANPHRRPLPLLKGEATGHIIRTQTAGPLGWNAAVLDLLYRLKL